jgi:hypothetical protein
MFLIKNSNPFLEFWRKVYPSFNQELYKTFDSIESKDKTIIDIGYSVALTTIYLSRISEKVHTINCNKNNSEKTTNIKNIIRDNCSNVTIFDGDFGNNITFRHLINYLNDNNINFNNLSFININLNGLEENFMQNFYEFQKNIKLPIIIQLYLSNWNDKNVSRFPFLNNFEIFDNCVIVLS